MFAGEFYTGSKVGVHTCLRRVVYWFKGRSSYLCGGEFYTGSYLFGDEYYTGSKVGVHSYLGTILYWFKGRNSYLFEENFILV